MSHYRDCSCVVYREQARESDLIHVAGSTRLSNSGARGQQTRLEDARASPDGCPSGLSHDPTDYMIRPANTAPCGEFTPDVYYIFSCSCGYLLRVVVFFRLNHAT